MDYNIIPVNYCECNDLVIISVKALDKKNYTC